MSEHEIHLPSGLSGNVQTWKTRDLRVFANRALMKRPGPAIEAELMKKAWLETLETGPYAFTGKPPWMTEILQGDLTDAVRQVRVLTFGANMDTDFECEKQSCDNSIAWRVPLDKLRIQKLSDESLHMFLNGNRIPWKFPVCGREVFYKLHTGTSATLMDKLVRQHGRCTEVVMASRLDSIEGVESKGKYVDFLGDLDPEDVGALNAEMERLECGVDTEIEIVCDDCGTVQQQEVPFGADFFTPHLQSKKKRKTPTNMSDDGTSG